MKKVTKSLLITAVVLGIAAPAGIQISHKLKKPPPPPKTVAAHIGEIVVKVSEAGTIEPVNQVDVRSKVAGRLLTMPIEEGQFIKKGQLIATVDRTLINPQIARVRAQLDQSRAALQQSLATYHLQSEQTQMAIVQAEANLHTAEAQLAAVRAPARTQEVAQQAQVVSRAEIALADAERTLKRKQALVEKGFIAQAEVDTAQTAVDTAASSLASARQQLNLTKAGPRTVDIDSARAQVAAARVAVASARVNALQLNVLKSSIAQSQSAVRQSNNDLAQLLVQLNDTSIVAPASGRVLKKYKQLNEIVQSATTGFSDTQSLVATLGDQPIVQVGVNEVDIAKVHNNDPVDIRVDALPDTVLHGRIAEIAPASTNSFSAGGSAAGNLAGISKFSVKISIDSPDPRLRPGMTANVDIISSRQAGVLLAPLETIAFTGNNGAVTVVTGKTKQDKRQVVLGRRNDTDVEVLSGLKAGENLVVVPPNGKDRRTIKIDGPDGG